MKFIKRIFGVDLTTLVKATNSIRPVLVEKCIEEIERRKGALETEGIYRVSGFSDAIDELKMAFDRGFETCRQIEKKLTFFESFLFFFLQETTSTLMSSNTMIFTLFAACLSSI